VAASRLQLRLSPVPEPLELREALLALGRERPRELIQRLGEGEWVVELLWSQWGAGLRRAGAERALLASVVRGYRLELWLWVVGERRWEQVLDGLAGRVARRVAQAKGRPVEAQRARSHRLDDGGRPARPQ
jgi:hypothetical protein